MNNIFDFRQFKVLTLMHFKEIIREPAVLFWGVIFPVLMSLVLGIAFSKSADSERTIGVVDAVEGQRPTDSLTAFGAIHSQLVTEPLSDEQSRFSFSLENNKLGKSVFEFDHLTWDDAISKLKQGKINIIISRQNGRYQYYFDPANPDAQALYIKLSQVLGAPFGGAISCDEDITVLSLPGTRYIDFLIPGLASMGIMMSIMWGLSYGLIEKRSNKLLRRMVATPMKSHYYLMSLFFVRIVMNFTESLILVFFAMLVFGITIQGNLLALFGVFLAGNLAFGGIAIFVSARTAKTEIGNGLINVVVMPMMLLSGVFFSYHNFPDAIVTIIKFFPLTMLADSMRSIFIEGAGFMQVSSSIVILSVTGFVFFFAGLKMFKWY